MLKWSLIAFLGFLLLMLLVAPIIVYATQGHQP